MRTKSPLQNRFVSLMEGIARTEGISPNAGRILGLLMMNEGPVSFSEISCTLKISRGSVSENTRLLIEHGIVERIQVDKSRKDHFQIREDAHTALLARRRTMTEDVIAQLRAIQGEFSTEEFQHQRLTQMSQFLSASIIATNVLEAQITSQKERKTESDKS